MIKNQSMHKPEKDLFEDGEVESLPNDEYGSDHLSISVDLRFAGL